MRSVAVMEVSMRSEGGRFTVDRHAPISASISATRCSITLTVSSFPATSCDSPTILSRPSLSSASDSFQLSLHFLRCSWLLARHPLSDKTVISATLNCPCESACPALRISSGGSLVPGEAARASSTPQVLVAKGRAELPAGHSACATRPCPPRFDCPAEHQQ